MQFYTLTARDVAAMRKANYLTVRYNGTSTVRAVKRAERTDNDPFAQDVEHDIPAPVTCRAYGATVTERTTACAIVSLYKFQAGPIDVLKTGDAVAFEFVAGNDNDYLRAAGLHHDELHVIVRRGAKEIVLTIAGSICPDNLARMVRGLDRAPEYSLTA